MNQYDYTPDRTPTPEQIAAWVDGESSRGEADFVEAWMADHPDARREADAMAQLTRLYRDQPLPLPSEERWRVTFDRIRPAVTPRPRRPWGLLLGLALASAAALGAVVLARSLWPTATPGIALPAAPAPDEEDDEPFAVAASSEVHIIRMDADDADAVVTGRPLIGTMDFTGPGDIDVLQVQPDPDEKHTPRLETRAALSWVVVRAHEEDEP
jgi:anti-sigma factor RsiW